MARIIIKESDLTTPIIETTSSEVVYVPGFGTNNNNYINASTAVGKGTPTLCRTVAEFNAYFGAIPAVFAGQQNYPEGKFAPAAVPDNTPMFGANTVDPSYIYAKELINAGIPVLYERLNDLNIGSDDLISVDDFYAALTGTTDYDPLENLNNINDFNIKYITSGGYPVFECGYSITATADENKGNNGPLGVQVDAGTFIPGHSSIKDYTFEYAIISAEATLKSSTIPSSTGKITVNSDLFTNQQNTEGDYTFTASVSSNVVTWTLALPGGSTISDISADVLTTVYGITLDNTLTVSNNNNIVVSVSNEKGWAESGESVDIADIGITITATPELGNQIIITVESANETSIVAKMLKVASERGDCVALIDHTNNPGRTLLANSSNSVYYSASDANSLYRISTNGTYGAMFTPWYIPTYITSSKPSTNAIINGSSAESVTWFPAAMPPSFAYLMSLAYSVRNNPDWFSVAGVTRGVVPNLVELNIDTRLTNAIADSYQPGTGISINPITNIRPYGYTIWGNRTLKDNSTGLTATSFLNIRNMVSDIKKQAYVAAMACLFEQNTDILWLNFKATVDPVLEQMTSGYGISSYKIIREPSADPTKIIATIRIYPVYAVESFEITVELSSDSVDVAE